MVTGVVSTGKGWASRDMGPWQFLPWKPHPGTLNVEIGDDNVAEFLSKVRHWSYYNNRKYPYRLGKLNGVDVAVTDSGVRPGGIEVVAPVRLRDLPLNDGDTVTIMLDDEVE